MNDIEAKIAVWREGMRRAMPQQEETVRELEGHLRDHLASRVRAGVTPEEAFAESVRRLGEVHGLAREFERVTSPWWPRSWTLRGILVMLVAGGGALLGAIATEFPRQTLTPLLAVHVAAISAGYLCVFCGGLVGGAALIKRWRRPLAAGEARELRDWLFRLTCASCGLVPVGIGLGMVWAAENRGAAWTWERVEVGAVFVLVATVLLLVVQTRVKVSDHFRSMLAVLGGTTVLFGMVGARAVTPAVPIAWLALAFGVSQVAVVMLRPRGAAASR